MGIGTIGELAQVSVAVLQKNFGVHGRHLFDLANGIDERDVHVDDEIKSVSHEHTFDQDTDQTDNIYSVLSFLSEKVSRRLRRYELKGRTVTLKIRLSSFKTVTRAHTFGERVNFYEDIYRQAKDLFDEFYSDGMKIRLLGVRVSHFDDPYVQDSLFQHPVSEKRERIHKAMDSIKDKFGEKAIHRARNMI